MEPLPPLFRAGRQWEVWVETAQDAAVLCTRYGSTGGKLTVARRTVTDPGRQDSAVAKACHDAHKKWRDKQTKEGYLMRAVDQRSCSADDPPPPACKPAVKSHMQVAQADLVHAVQPMLAHPMGKVKAMAMPCLGQPKIDGFRCMADVRHGVLISRKNIAFRGFAALKACIRALATHLPAQGLGSGRLYLDGELHLRAGSQDFNDLTRVMKRGQQHDDFDHPEVVLRVFDCLDLDAPDAPFGQRHALVARLCTALPLTVVPVFPVPTAEAVPQLLQDMLDAGHEGLMLRDPDAAYVQRKRAQGLQKVKQFTDAEFVIVGHKEGHGIDAGTVVWECAVPGADKTFWVRPMGTRDQRADWLRHAAKHVGSLLTVKYQELSKDGVPRFPVGKALRPAFDV